MNLKWALAAAGLGAPLAAAGIFTALQLGLAYHSPFYSPAPPPPTPRQQAYLDLAEAARQKAEAEAARAELLASLTTEKMVGLGEEIVHGKGLCLNCHTIGAEGGTQGPVLDGVGERAGSRVDGMSDVDYLAQSLYEPETFIVEGFAPAMIPANKAPVGLSDDEIVWVIAYLQSLGGTPTVTPETRLSYAEAGP